MSLDSWALIWKWVFFLGLTSFFVLAVVIIPLGWRDLVALFAKLRAGGEGAGTPDVPAGRAGSTSPPTSIRIRPPKIPPSQS